MSVTLRIEKETGYIELDQPDSKVNLLTAEAIERLDGILDKIKSDPTIKVVVIVSKKPDVFVAGADIKEIEKITGPVEGAQKAKAGQDVFNKLEDLTVPTIAVIDGVALGGGCELALACYYRVATLNDKVRIGLPEVNLGFVPGFGGTYRLPRTVGLFEGLTMILGGQPISGEKAFKVGLVDRLFPSQGLMDHVDQFIKEILSGRFSRQRFAPKPKKGLIGILEEKHSPVGNWILFKQTTNDVLQKTKGFYPAPLKAIEVIKKSYYLRRREGLALEARAFGELAVTDISKNLVKVFYLSEKFKKLKAPGTEHLTSKAIHKCGVLGAGIMGGGIAQLLSSKGIWARLKDINLDAIAKGYQAASKLYSQAVSRKKMTRAAAAEKMAHITGTLDYSGFGNVDMVIEAVVENMDIKKKVFKELSDAVPEGAILASNTSALSVTEMANVTKNPSRVIGFHFFNPVNRMPLVEVITTPMTSPHTVVTALDLVKKLGKTPILVKDSCGFIVNRILLGYINEAGRLLEECGELEKIDRLVTDFGMPMGPFTLSDEVGLDVGIKVLHILEDHLGERFKPVDIFEKVYQKGFLGKKSGKGYYIHAKKRKVNPGALALLKNVQPNKFNAEQYLDRLILIMLNEAARCLDEKIVDDPDAIDIGMIFGTGFPPFHGGLLRYADSQGIPEIISKLESLAQQLSSDRFAPCPYLLHLRDHSKTFYG